MQTTVQSVLDRVFVFDTSQYSLVNSFFFT